jgi:serpin B
MRFVSSAVLLSSVLAAAACDRELLCAPNDPCQNRDLDPELPGTAERSLVPYNTSPDVSQAALAEAGENALLLATELAAASDQNGNWAISPVSVQEAFGMLSAGANGATLTELEDALHLEPQAELHNRLNAWNLGLANRDIAAQEADAEQGIAAADPVELDLVNQLFAAEDFEIASAFLDTTSASYDAGVQRVPFRSDPDGVRQDINGWVQDVTRDRIKDLLPDDSVTTDTRLVLVNALYLKAPWATPFEATATADATFHAPDGDVTVPFLNGSVEGGYATTEDAVIVDLPLRGGQLAVTLFVDATDTPADPLTNWRAIETLTPSLVQLSLPRYTIDTDVDLGETLKAIGVTTLFDAEVCDLDGINAEENLYVSAAFHKSFVALEEGGVEAAAATAIVVNDESSPGEFHTVDVNRPFTFVIRDVALGAPLFVGRVVDPG